MLQADNDLAGAGTAPIPTAVAHLCDRLDDASAQLQALAAEGQNAAVGQALMATDAQAVLNDFFDGVASGGPSMPVSASTSATASA